MWARDYQENQITIIYDSMWGSTNFWRAAYSAADIWTSTTNCIESRLQSKVRST